MIQICTAEDGQVFQTKSTLRDIERIGSLEAFVHAEIGIDTDAVIAYISNGQRLTNANIRELAGSQDQTIFVFNKYYLDHDLEDVLRNLSFQPQFQAPLDDAISATPPLRHAQFAATCLRNANEHHHAITQTQRSVHFQHESARIATTTLDSHVLVILDTFDGIAIHSKRELEKQASLLAGLAADLELITQVRVHVEFLSNTVRKAIEAGEKSRTLADYVSNVKMNQVADACRRTHEELKVKFEQVELAVSKVKEGADIIRSALNEVKLIQDADSLARRSQETVDRIAECMASLESPTSSPDAILHELRQLDAVHRDETQAIYDIKNTYTQHHLATLRRISLLNNDLVHLPQGMSTLQISFRNKNSFAHIQRLHNMLYAYGATVIEIVRRKEFSRFFYQRAQSILEVMAKLSASERKRRQVYRSEVHGQLPFETKGMDDPVPTIDFSPSGSSDFSYSLERPDVDGLLRVLEDLEQYSRSRGDESALNAVIDCRGLLDKLVGKMDSLETGFDKIAERSLLSASRIMTVRKRTLDMEEQAYQELVEELRNVEESKAREASIFDEERRSLKAEIQRLKQSSEDSGSKVAQESKRANTVERELLQVRAHAENESNARRIVEERNQELAKDIESQRVALSRALADATEQSKSAEKLKQELSQVRSEFNEVKELESRSEAKVAALLEEQGNTLRKLEEARSRGEDLETQIQAARAESEEVRQALKSTSGEKDRLLKAQASEHDRIIRDHIAEADGDRAVLERQFFELKAVQEHSERQVKDLRAEIEIANADAVGLREELRRVEHELRDAKHVERLLREDLKAGRSSQSEFERRAEEREQLIAQILEVAIAFRNTEVKGLHTAQAVSTLPPSGSKHGHALGESMTLTSMRHHNVMDQTGEPSPIDPSDPVAALEVLREFDHDHFLEAIVKTGSTIKKWQKQCREYRERAKGKISFRNFAKGDLALFLPTRNSVSKPWAAFNVSFPHYFLQATGHLAEQLRTREWIVARITSISERVVDHRDETTNPYGLGDGVKYYMLEVEDWTQPSQHKRRGPSRRVTTEREPADPSQSTPNLLRPTSPVPLPEPSVTEVEDTFHRPSSHNFPTRTRSSSSPGARPSSLSRLLAQASPTQEKNLPTNGVGGTDGSVPPEPLPIVEDASPTPDAQDNFLTTSPPPQLSPTLLPVPIPRPLSSPLRPGSRASRLSTTSRFSVGRIPTLGAVASVTSSKAAPTVALVEQSMAGSSPSSYEASNPFVSPTTPSPDDSISDAMANVIMNSDRRRTLSHHTPRPSPLSVAAQNPAIQQVRATSATSALANLASSWGFGRKKRAETTQLTPPSESPVDNSTTDATGEHPSNSSQPSAAHALLKRF